MFDSLEAVFASALLLPSYLGMCKLIRDVREAKGKTETESFQKRAKKLISVTAQRGHRSGQKVGVCGAWLGERFGRRSG